jgi:hypothetical protein
MNRKTFNNKYFSTDIYEQWSQLFKVKQYNWLEFDWLKVYSELDRHLGTAEFEIAILGLGVRVYWVCNSTVYDQKMKEFETIIIHTKKKKSTGKTKNK